MIGGNLSRLSLEKPRSCSWPSVRIAVRVTVRVIVSVTTRRRARRISRIGPELDFGDVETAIEVGVEAHAHAGAQRHAGVGQLALLGQGAQLSERVASLVKQARKEQAAA